MRSTCDIACQRNMWFEEEGTSGPGRARLGRFHRRARRIDRIFGELSGRVVLVVGMGESGHAAALFLLYKGAKVRCTDIALIPSVEERGKELECLGAGVEVGRHTQQFCEGCELVVVSPGVDPHSPPLIWAEAKGVPVISEIELGFRFCRSKIVGITGTNGKTTTCELINEILKEGGLTTATAGNIGLPLVRKVAEEEAPEVLVVEISSFQLERIDKFRPHISVVLNVTEDHLDRYSSFQEYAKAKKRIAENQREGDFLIVNETAEHIFSGGGGAGCPTVFKLGRSADADLVVGDGKVISRVSGREKCYEVRSCTGPGQLRGEHNLENVGAAIGVAEIEGVGEEAIYSAVSRFRGLRHRIEFVDEVRGVEFFDDSKGTNVDAVVKALESFSQPVILIAGGRDKGGDYTPLRDAARRKVKLAVAIGEAQGKLTSSLDGAAEAVAADGMDAAVEAAFGNAVRGDVVLLSPACSSFDMFADYKERGDAFQRKVKQLKEKLQEGRRNHEAA